LRTFVRNVGKMSKELADNEAVMRPGKTLEELKKTMTEKEAYLKTPRKVTSVLKRVEPATAVDEERFFDEELSNLSLVTSYNNKFAKELRQETPTSQRNSTSNPCFEFIKGKCQLGSGCQYSHQTVDCQRKVDEDLVKVLTNTFLSDKASRLIDWKKFDDFKQDILKQSGSVKFLSGEDGVMLEGKHTEMSNTPLEKMSGASTPASTSSKYMMRQVDQLRELSEEEQLFGGGSY
jgi:hypothetical protein